MKMYKLLLKRPKLNKSISADALAFGLNMTETMSSGRKVHLTLS
jgi:hypothetical protein